MKPGFKITQEDKYLWMTVDDVEDAVALAAVGLDVCILYDDDTETEPESFAELEEAFDNGCIFGVGLGHLQERKVETPKGIGMTKAFADMMKLGKKQLEAVENELDKFDMEEQDMDDCLSKFKADVKKILDKVYKEALKESGPDYKITEVEFGSMKKCDKDKNGDRYCRGAYYRMNEGDYQYKLPNGETEYSKFNGYLYSYYAFRDDRKERQKYLAINVSDYYSHNFGPDVKPQSSQQKRGLYLEIPVKDFLHDNKKYKRMLDLITQMAICRYTPISISTHNEIIEDMKKEEFKQFNEPVVGPYYYRRVDGD